MSGKGNNGGPFLPGWPVTVVSTRFLPVVAQGIPISPAMADLDGDKVPEVIISGLASVLKVFDSHGTNLAGKREHCLTRHQHGLSPWC